jgi:RecB family exonuclease
MVWNKDQRKEFKISYSRINTFLFCPYKYKLIYIDDQHFPTNGDIAFGHSIHNTLEKFHSQNGKDFEKLKECFDECWKNEGFLTPMQSFQYYLRGQELLKNYFDSFLQSKTEIIYTEKHFDANIGKYRFVGIMDRIDKYPDGTYEVMDYKTHIKIWEQEKVDKDLQLSFYAYACRNILGISVDKISVYFLSHNKKIFTTRSNEQIQDAIELALDVAQKINDEEFEADTSKCEFCDFRIRCGFSSCKENGRNDGGQCS